MSRVPIGWKRLVSLSMPMFSSQRYRCLATPSDDQTSRTWAFAPDIGRILAAISEASR